MKILITGATGMLGRKLLDRLLSDCKLAGAPIESIDLHDVVPGNSFPTQNITITRFTGDLAAPGAAKVLIARRPDVIFHLAGVVSGEAEANFDLGYAVNVDRSRLLFEAIRDAAYNPRLVFSSSAAVFGAPFPDTIPDDYHLTPLTSYGTQKMIVEAFLNDYTRRGFFDGVGVRLPAICIRPGKPNKAASGFFSGIIREPLNGIPATVPVPRDILHTAASPRSAISFLLRAAEIDSALVGPHRNLTMPGVCCTVGEQIEALERVAGKDVAALVTDKRDEAIWSIVKTWSTRFESRRAKELGFKSESNFDEIIRIYIEDEMQGARK